MGFGLEIVYSGAGTYFYQVIGGSDQKHYLNLCW